MTGKKRPVLSMIIKAAKYKKLSRAVYKDMKKLGYEPEQFYEYYLECQDAYRNLAARYYS